MRGEGATEDGLPTPSAVSSEFDSHRTHARRELPENLGDALRSSGGGVSLSDYCNVAAAGEAREVATTRASALGRMGDFDA
jgi:hypothetical protein